MSSVKFLTPRLPVFWIQICIACYSHVTKRAAFAWILYARTEAFFQNPAVPPYPIVPEVTPMSLHRVEIWYVDILPYNLKSPSIYILKWKIYDPIIYLKTDEVEPFQLYLLHPKPRVSDAYIRGYTLCMIQITRWRHKTVNFKLNKDSLITYFFTGTTWLVLDIY